MSGTQPGLDQVLPTKLFIPLLEQDVLARRRLLDRLGAASGSGMVLVSAPAGSGKTTLIADWVRRSDHQAGWLSLDATDDDPRIFLRYLAEAFETIEPGIGKRVRTMLRSTPPPEPRLATHTLIADIATAGVEGFVIIDDYHSVSNPAIHDILSLLAERIPAAVTLVVITRSDPPLPLARMRVRRQLHEIREADLRFETGEAAEFITRFCGRELRPDLLAALADRTEGWAAGLQLAGLALRSAPDPEAFIADFQGTHAFIADYLTDEVLATIPPEHQQFVVRSSLLDRLCGPLCDTALEISGSQTLLEELHRANLFLVPLDAERRWFRYHHLFADLLRRRSHETNEQERNAVLVRAAKWCAHNEAVDDAVGYGVRAGDILLAADLVAQHGIQALAAGEGYKALRWSQLLPNETVEASPDHCVIAAWAHSLDERYEPIGSFADRALEVLEHGRRPHPYVDDVALHARILRAGADAFEGKGGDVDRAVDEIVAVLGEAPPDSVPLRASAELMTGNLLWLRGRYAGALGANERAWQIGVRAESDLLRLAAVTGLAQTHLVGGSLGQAIAVAEKELERRQSTHEVLGNQIANVCAILALAHLEQGDPTAAERVLRRCQSSIGHGEDLVDEWPATTWFRRVRHVAFHSSAPLVHFGLAAYVGLLLQHGETAAAERYLAALEDSVAAPAGPAEQVLIDSLRVRVLFATEQRARLMRWSEVDFEESTGCSYWDDVRRITRARALLGAGDSVTAGALLEELLTDLSGRETHLGLADAYILHALACAESSRRDAEAHSVDRALELTAQDRRVLPWLDAGVGAAPLLERAVARASAASDALSHAVSLLARLQQGEPAPGPNGGTLSDRELAVLRLVAAGHTNQQIGKALFLAVGTVKKHTHNIYAKLDVSNRTQAVQVARDSGLLTAVPGSSAE